MCPWFGCVPLPAGNVYYSKQITIIERSVPYDLGGGAKASYNPKGTKFEFVIPARHVVDAKDSAGPMLNLWGKTHDNRGLHKKLPPPGVRIDETLLLVEDSLIIALDVEDIAAQLEAREVQTYATVQGALDAIDRERPSVAVLGINLGDANSFPVADRLAELGVPFFFASGYGEQARMPSDRRARKVIQKPYTVENLARAFATLFGADDI